MKRRDFIKRTSLASAALMVPAFLKPMERYFPGKGIKNLVIVQLDGGNDWLNTVIPYKNDVYYKARPKLGLKDKNIIPLEKDLALHSSLLSLKEIYDAGEMAIVNNVGYPHPDRSHFRSMDIWHSASGAHEYIHTGWIGRLLDSSGKSAYEAFEIENKLSLALKGQKLSGIAARDLKHLYKELKSPFYSDLVTAVGKDPLPDDQQEFLYRTLIQTESGINYLMEKDQLVSNNKEYPAGGLGKHLKGVATLIASGSLTRVYYVHQSGYDTHAGQMERHKKLLQSYSDSLSTFIANLKELGVWENTLIMTFSEFGRRVEENASGGTDHGTAGNVLLFGKTLKKKGIVNELPDLGNLDDGDLRHSIDFRSIYKDVLKNWLGADAASIIPAQVKNIEIV